MDMTVADRTTAASYLGAFLILGIILVVFTDGILDLSERVLMPWLQRLLKVASMRSDKGPRPSRVAHVVGLWSLRVVGGLMVLVSALGLYVLFRG